MPSRTLAMKIIIFFTKRFRRVTVNIIMNSKHSIRKIYSSIRQSFLSFVPLLLRHYLSLLFISFLRFAFFPLASINETEKNCSQASSVVNTFLFLSLSWMRKSSRSGLSRTTDSSLTSVCESL